jgi:hypothetical protein
MSDFLVKWLKGWSLFTIAFGAIFAVMDLSGLGQPARLFTDIAFLRMPGSAPLSVGKEGLLMGGIMGAVMMGWGLYVHQTVETLARADAGVLRRALIGAVTRWFLADQAVSWRAGAYGNMVSNVAFYVVFMLPFVMGRGRQGSATSAA